ncbi:interleukin-27 subunit beta-like [Protobothrops mucrosquamatus]|uniref:interleukin-27 subunit beta-like n=1 Tax=Protobothrops mucrosquamatus TaxID=103944 RepID=UPI000775F24E|nr:interleukin-27 subunit beta-like [Protobothrops mucrosquamatus]
MLRTLLALLLFQASGLLASTSATWTTEEPIHHQYARLGASTVVLSCPVPEGGSQVGWKNHITSETVLNGVQRDGSLVLQNASLAQEGEYSCQDGTTGQTLRRIRLQLGYPPEKLSIHCRSVSYPSVNCSWTLETDTRLPTSFFASYRHGLMEEVHQCIQPVAGSHSCSMTALQMFSTDPYRLNVTAVNPLGTASHFSLVSPDQIIRPDPPENVMVSPIQGKTNTLLVQWKAPSSWLYPEYFPLKYVMRYSRDGSRQIRTIRPIEKTSFTLSGIRSGVKYHIQVAAKDFLDNGEYSAWSLLASGASWEPE